MLSQGNSRQVPSLSLGKASLTGTGDSSVAVVFSKLTPLLLGTLKVFRASILTTFGIFLLSVFDSVRFDSGSKDSEEQRLHSESRAAALGPH